MMDYWCGVFSALICSLVLCVVWTVLSEVGGGGAKEIRKEAINRGYAEYVVDTEGSTEFKWKENKK